MGVNEVAAQVANGDLGDKGAGDMSKERYQYHLRVETAYGKIYEGTFVNKILTGNEKMRAAEIAGRLRGGLAFEAIEPGRANYTEQMGWLLCSLDRESLPSWAKDLGAIIDDEVVNALFEKAREHEKIFRRPRSDQKAG
jgi:hypothetical protein